MPAELILQLNKPTMLKVNSLIHLVPNMYATSVTYGPMAAKRSKVMTVTSLLNSQIYII